MWENQNICTQNYESQVFIEENKYDFVQKNLKSVFLLVWEDGAEEIIACHFKKFGKEKGHLKFHYLSKLLDKKFGSCQSSTLPTHVFPLVLYNKKNGNGFVIILVCIYQHFDSLENVCFKIKDKIQQSLRTLTIN